MSMQEQLNVAARVEETLTKSTYENLCDLVDMSPVSEQVSLDTFRDANSLAETRADERLTAALNVFLDMAGDSNVSRIDKSLLDNYVSKIDQVISQQLDEVLHHQE